MAVCGRRWGKTATGLIATVDGHGPFIGERPALKGALDGGKIWWVTFDYPTASEIWRDLKHACKGAWTDKSEVERRIELPSGGSVTVRSAHEPDKLVATGLDGLVLDEAGKMPKASWDFLRPTLVDKQGWAFFIGTPRGYNWFHGLYQFAGSEPGWARWRRPSRDNPLITDEELAKAKREAPRLYGQEYEARFEQPEGAEWPPEYFSDDLWFERWPPGPWQCKAMALDPSKGKEKHKHKEGREPDYSAFVWGGLDPDGVIWLDADLDNVRDATRIVQDGIGLCRVFQPQALLVEINQFQELFGGEFIRQAKAINTVLPLWGVTNFENKETRIREVGPCLAQRMLRFRRSRGCEMLVAQLRDFPAGEYDDGPDALQMLLKMLAWLKTGAVMGAKPVLLRA